MLLVRFININFKLLSKDIKISNHCSWFKKKTVYLCSINIAAYSLLYY